MKLAKEIMQIKDTLRVLRDLPDLYRLDNVVFLDAKSRMQNVGCLKAEFLHSQFVLEFLLCCEHTIIMAFTRQ